jgi:hypothetical protein
MQVKYFNMLASRESLVMIAIVASAITMHVRLQATPAQSAEHLQYGRMCEPTVSADTEGKARVQPADCELRQNLHTGIAMRPWV